MEKTSIYYPMAESIEKEGYVVATYLAKVEIGKSALEYAIEVAIDQTTGTWTPVPAETEEVKTKHRAKVMGVYEIPQDEDASSPKTCIFQIAFPHINFGHSIAMLFSTVLGNNSSMGQIKLLDLTFPKGYCEGFAGPKFGVKGIRDLLKVYDRPLLCNMIKPCTGIPPTVGAELAYEASLGGCDFIKDDELIANESFSSTTERADLFIKRLKASDDQKGEKTLFLLNITDRPDLMVEHALRAIEKGANALMINYVTVGLDAVRMITENKDIQVPVLGHCTMSGGLSMSHWNGVGVGLLTGKLARMMGLDISLIYMPGGRFFLSEDAYTETANMLVQDLYNLRPAFPMPGGSVHPGVVDRIIKNTGKECVISAGGAIHGHPSGATAGAKAMRQGIDLALSTEAVAEKKLKDYPEYQTAIAKWGKG